MTTMNIRGGIPWELGDLFHISFNGKLAGEWVPMKAAAPEGPEEDTSDKEPWPYPEPSMACISCSPSIEGCFLGVYPNVYHLFDGNKRPWMHFFVYRPVLTGKERVLTPDDLTTRRLVWDAHVTREYRILDKVVMELVGSVQVANTERTTSRKTRPFNDPKLPLTTCGPKEIRIKRLT